MLAAAEQEGSARWERFSPFAMTAPERTPDCHSHRSFRRATGARICRSVCPAIRGRSPTSSGRFPASAPAAPRCRGSGCRRSPRSSGIPSRTPPRRTLHSCTARGPGRPAGRRISLVPARHAHPLVQASSHVGVRASHVEHAEVFAVHVPERVVARGRTRQHPVDRFVVELIGSGHLERPHRRECRRAGGTDRERMLRFMASLAPEAAREGRRLSRGPRPVVAEVPDSVPSHRVLSHRSISRARAGGPSIRQLQENS